MILCHADQDICQSFNFSPVRYVWSEFACAWSLFLWHFLVFICVLSSPLFSYSFQTADSEKRISTYHKEHRYSLFCTLMWQFCSHRFGLDSTTIFKNRIIFLQKNWFSLITAFSEFKHDQWYQPYIFNFNILTVLCLCFVNSSFVILSSCRFTKWYN